MVYMHIVTLRAIHRGVVQQSSNSTDKTHLQSRRRAREHHNGGAEESFQWWRDQATSAAARRLASHPPVNHPHLPKRTPLSFFILRNEVAQWKLWMKLNDGWILNGPSCHDSAVHMDSRWPNQNPQKQHRSNPEWSPAPRRRLPLTQAGPHPIIDDGFR